MAAGYVITDTYLQHFVSALLGVGSPSYTGWHLRLFQNNITIDNTVQSTTPLTEATFGGYAAAALDPTTFSTITIAGNVANAKPSSATAFPCTGAPQPQNVYGYYVTDSGGTLVWAESFASPQSVSTGGTYNITPQMNLKTC